MEARGGASKGRRRGARGWVLGTLACCGLALAPAAAPAATVALTTGPDPVESLTTQVTASGSVDDIFQAVQVTVKPTGGPGCGANFGADSGRTVIDDEPGTGPYTLTSNITYQQAGSYLLCAWVTDVVHDSPPAASTSQTVTVRLPHLSLSLAAPATVLRGRLFEVTMTAQTEAERDVEVGLLDDVGRGCPANWGAAVQATGEETVFSTSVIGGPSAQTENVHLFATGRYLLCGYVDYGEQVSPEATAAASITVVPPCVVPHLGPGTSLRVAKARIVAAHCTVGRIRSVASRRRRGTVIALSPRPGTGHATHAAVRITVSSGPRHRRHRR